jgi:hypothetical protein
MKEQFYDEGAHPVLERPVAETPIRSTSEDIEETEDPGILHKLTRLTELGTSLDEPLLAFAIPESDAVEFAFWAGDPALMQSARDLIRGDVTYDKAIRDGLLNRFRTWFEGFVFEGRQISPPHQRLPIGEMHTPHIAGCAVTFAQTSSGSLSVCLKVVGLGYQRVKKVTLEDDYTEEQQCAQLTIGVDFVVHVYRSKFTGERRALIHEITMDSAVSGRPLPSHFEHPCGPGYEKTYDFVRKLGPVIGHKLGSDYSDIPMRAQASKKRGMLLEVGTSYKAAFKIPLVWPTAPDLSTTLSLKVESTITKTVKIQWTLAGGHDYLSYRRVPGDMRYFWAWD